MDQPWPDPQIPVRRNAAGLVTIGEQAPAVAGVGYLPILGGTAYVDPATPTAIPVFEIADVEAAYEGVADLLGSEVADACVQLEESEGSEVLATIVPAPDLTWLVDLAALHWLDLSAPWPLDEPVRALEAAVLGVRIASLHDGQDPIDECLALLDHIYGALLSPERLPEPVDDLVREAADAIISGLPVGDPRGLRLQQMLADAHAGPAPVGRIPDFATPVAVCTPEPALSMGADGAGATFFDTDAVDWRFVRRGIVGRGETAMSWTLDLSADSPQLDVSVDAARLIDSCLGGPPWSPRRPSHLECVAYAGDQPRVLALGRLLRQPERGTWAGTMPVGGDVPELLDLVRRGPGLRVVVHEPGRTPAPISASARVAAAARRWASRGLCAARLGTVEAATQVGVLDAARAALATSRSLWGIVPGPAAAARAGRCEELIRSLTQGTFEPRPSVAESLGSAPSAGP